MTERIRPYSPPVTAEKIARALQVPDIGVHGLIRALEITRGSSEPVEEDPVIKRPIEGLPADD